MIKSKTHNFVISTNNKKYVIKNALENVSLIFFGEYLLEF